MQHNRLKLVIPEDTAKATTDGTAELVSVTGKRDLGHCPLRLLIADEGPAPDDAA
jgi:hypothetical protein